MRVCGLNVLFRREKVRGNARAELHFIFRRVNDTAVAVGARKLTIDNQAVLRLKKILAENSAGIFFCSLFIVNRMVAAISSHGAEFAIKIFAGTSRIVQIPVPDDDALSHRI